MYAPSGLARSTITTSASMIWSNSFPLTAISSGEHLRLQECRHQVHQEQDRKDSRDHVEHHNLSHTLTRPRVRRKRSRMSRMTTRSMADSFMRPGASGCSVFVFGNVNPGRHKGSVRMGP